MEGLLLQKRRQTLSEEGRMIGPPQFDLITGEHVRRMVYSVNVRLAEWGADYVGLAQGTGAWDEEARGIPSPARERQ